MSQTVIENPVICSAFREPGRHFKFSDEGITDEIIEDRRPSSYFVEFKSEYQVRFPGRDAENLTDEDMPEVIRYAKNNKSLGFNIPYTLNGEEKNYEPDFIACINDGKGVADPLQLLIEVTGEQRKDKAAKVSTAKTLWVPAVNNHGGFGRWDIIEIYDPWDSINQIRKFIHQRGNKKC